VSRVFSCGQVVQLREVRQNVRPGERGRVIGRYTNDRTLLVAFGRTTIRVEPELVRAAGRVAAAA
jgi:ribonuclease PH